MRLLYFKPREMDLTCLFHAKDIYIVKEDVYCRTQSGEEGLWKELMPTLAREKGKII